MLPSRPLMSSVMQNMLLHSLESVSETRHCPASFLSQPMSGMSRRTGQAFGAIRSRTHGELLLVVYRLGAVGHLESVLEQGGMAGMSVLVRRSCVPLIVVERSLVVLLSLLFLSMLVQICLCVFDGMLSVKMMGGLFGC
jgi:hypothetical protein